MTRRGEEAREEPPNGDIIHVKEQLRYVLMFFNNCHNALPNVFSVPIIGELLKKLSDEGLEFYTYVQKTVAQNNNLEAHVNDMTNLLETEGLNLDSNCFNKLFDTTRQDKETAEEIKEKYNSIKNNLVKLDHEYYTNMTNREEELHSLREKKEDLETKKYINTDRFNFFIVCTVVALLMERGINTDNSFLTNIMNLNVNFSFIIPVALIVFMLTTYFEGNTEKGIRKIERKIKKLEDDKILIEKSKREFENICNQLKPVVNQMGVFNNYWEMQYGTLKELCNNFDDTSNEESRKLLKPRCNEIKILCNNHISTVRRIVSEVHNSRNENEDVKNESFVIHLQKKIYK